MRHMTGSVYAMFDHEVHMYRGTTMAGIVQDEAKHDPAPASPAVMRSKRFHWACPFSPRFSIPARGAAIFTSFMDNYANVAGMWLVGEDLPRETHRVTLNTDVKDQHGLPVPNVHYDDSPNDIAMRDHAFERGEEIYNAAGATKTFRTSPYPSTPNLGTSRMSADPALGVVNKHGQAHDVANLFVSDGSQYTTSASENPTLTIVTLPIGKLNSSPAPCPSNWWSGVSNLRASRSDPVRIAHALGAHSRRADDDQS